MSTHASAVPVRSVQTSEPSGMPDEAAIRKQHRSTRRSFRLLVTVAGLLSVALILWVFIFAPITEQEAAKLDPAVSITLVLAPILAAAAGVERTLETTFNMIENSWKSVVAYLGKGMRWLNAAELEVWESRQLLDDVSERYNKELHELKISETMSVSDLSDEMQKKISNAKAMLALAQNRLNEAETNLANATSSDAYRSAKAAASIALGLILGVVVAALGKLQMFAMLGIDGVPARVDVFITGLVIGTGSNPVHSLIGILQQTKDTVDGAKSYLNRLGMPFTAQMTTETRPTAGAGVKKVENLTVETTEKPVTSS